jgi:Uncharacterized protein conserved in bacteria
MQPRFESLTEKKLVGLSTIMSFSGNKTGLLWRSFMPRSREFTTVNTFLYSVEVYPPRFFEAFDMQREFEKWAAVEVADFTVVPEGMQQLVIPEGLYAVFIHKGPASEGFKTYNYIFETWMPSSGFGLDQRPHFALMGAKYKNESPDSEEEIWIPVKRRN